MFRSLINEESLVEDLVVKSVLNCAVDVSNVVEIGMRVVDFKDVWSPTNAVVCCSALSVAAIEVFSFVVGCSVSFGVSIIELVV